MAALPRLVQVERRRLSRTKNGGTSGDGRAAVSFSGAVHLTRRRAIAIAGAAALPVAGSAARESIVVAAEPVAFSPGGARSAGRLIYRGGLALHSEDPRFGGWSDLWIAPAGDRLLMISDRGDALEAPLRLSETGAPETVGPAELRRLVHHDGRPLDGRRWTDAEGLAAAPDGGFFVSFEQAHRIVHYPAAAFALTLPSRPVAPPPGIERAPPNAGLEAIAAWPDGTVVAFAEDLRDEAGDTRAWIGTPPAWREFSWSHDGFKPTGAVVAHDGALLVLERRFSFFSLAARVLRVQRHELQPGMRVAGDVLGEWGAPETVDNFEGIAARSGAEGEPLVYVLSDDNFRRGLQRTLLLCFAIG